MVKEVKFNLTKAQITKIVKAINKEESVTLRLNKSSISHDGTPLILTANEVKLLADDKNHDIEISNSRLVELGANWIKHHSSDKNIGGILPLIPALLAAVPIIAKVLGIGAAAATTAGAVAGTVKSIKDIGHEKRKTDAYVENEKRKADAYVEKARTTGHGLSLKRGGKGLYLRRTVN